MRDFNEPLSEDEKQALIDWLKRAFDPERRGVCVNTGHKIVFEGLVAVCCVEEE